MKTNPYINLLLSIQDFCKKIECRREKGMWYYEKSKLDTSWKLKDLYERVAAGKQLGYDVVLKTDEKGLHVFYVEEIPEIPYRFKSLRESVK